MKKHLMRKGFPKRAKIHAANMPKPDIARLIMGLSEHLVVLEGKINTLLNRTGEEKSFMQLPRQHNEIRRENNFRERVLHKAICADCNKECEVPFKPTGDRPVYCKECFAKRKKPQPPLRVEAKVAVSEKKKVGSKKRKKA